ncbi:MAG: hypothetical protein Q4F65_04215 [Propionibacteriaceae bacterium]|nr:hypothetical protein [Propionibacteriaceae bacterium]
MWGLPRIESWRRTVTLLDPDGRMSVSRYIRPRVAHPAHVVEHDGLRLTSVARTIVELACTGTLDTALAAADYALRLRMCSRQEIEDEVALLSPGIRGRGAAGLVTDLADGASGSPAESLSRLQMFRANLPRPRLQQEFWDDAGLIGFSDFDWDHLIGECDGQSKYNVPEGASPAEAGDIVWQEKQREDRLRRLKPVARWTWTTATSTAALARHLLSFGLRPEPTSTWIDLGRRPEAR